MVPLFRSLVVAGVILLGCSMVRAQQPADSAPAGTVMGTVMCGDTQRPARFANVALMPLPAETPAAKQMSDKEMSADPAAAMKMLRAQMATTTVLRAETALDGSYVITNVPPGDYYLSPTVAGYVSTLAAAQAAAPPGATGRKLYASVPMVHVEANRTARGDVALDRGAAVSGTVAFDDGGPAGTIVVTLEPAVEPKPDRSLGGFAMMLAGFGGRVAFADDRGRYRIAGIPSGDYVVKATLQVDDSFSIRAGVTDSSSLFKTSPMQIYSPGTVHKNAATKLTLGAGEERTDANITLDLTAMHSVSGTIASAIDHHALNQGVVTLTDATDKDFNRSASIDASGSFTVHYVPSGTYTLEVSGASDAVAVKQKAGVGLNFASMHTVKSYDEASQALVVAATDVTGVNIELKESKTVKKDFDMNDALKD